MTETQNFIIWCRLGIILKNTQLTFQDLQHFRDSVLIFSLKETAKAKWITVSLSKYRVNAMFFSGSTDVKIFVRMKKIKNTTFYISQTHIFIKLMMCKNCICLTLFST